MAVSHDAEVAQERPAALPVIDVSGERGWEGLLDGPAREELEHTALPAFLQSQRWFGGKARAVESVRIADWGPLPTSGVAAAAFLTLIEVRFAGDGSDLYFLPLAITASRRESRPEDAPHRDAIARLTGPDGEALLHDALDDETVCETLLDAPFQEREFAMRRGRIRAEATAAYPALRGDPDDPLPAVRAPATSSNSLLFYGERLLLKVFRRLEVGTNPDYEVGRFLTEENAFDHLPQVAGAFEYRRADGRPVTLGIFQAIVPNQGDGWQQALEEMRSYYDRVARLSSAPLSDQRHVTELVTASPPPEVASAIDGYLDAAAILGRRTAEMHVALAKPSDDPNFAPEPLTESDREALLTEIRSQAQRAFDALRENLDRLPNAIAADARRLLDTGPANLERRTRERPALPSALKTRIHGDYHLGQVLWIENDYVLLDFEGEPTRTIEERRAKFSPVRDVAGMLRSYHYAAWAGLFEFTKDRPRDFDRLVPWADLWQQWVSAAFLREYLAAARGAAFLPQSPREFAELLDGFTLAKALYELAYELNNRPDWVRIPLSGVRTLLNETHQ